MYSETKLNSAIVGDGVDRNVFSSQSTFESGTQDTERDKKKKDEKKRDEKDERKKNTENLCDKCKTLKSVKPYDGISYLNDGGSIVCRNCKIKFHNCKEGGIRYGSPPHAAGRVVRG